MQLPTELCKMQRKKRKTDGFSKSTWMTPPGSHPTSGFGTRHGLPKFFRHKKRRIVQNDVLADAIRLNLLSERIDIVKPVGWPRSGKTLNDIDMKYILRRMEKYGIFSEKKIESAIRIVANENRYHPIRDYLNGLKWDGTERIAHVLHHFLGAAEDEYTCEAMKIFLLGAIKRVFQPGCKFEIMLCLVGGQGAGKSAFFRLLAVKDEWFSDDLRRLDDDNVYRKLQGHWIIEMSEMIATANAKSIEEIKSFLSKQKETYKVPYETHPADRLRQCVFAGTTNRQDFLPRDRTGNRRFIPIPVDAELSEVHILDDEAESHAYIDQLWAEAMIIYNSGNYKLAFSPAMQETLQARQQDFMQEDAQAGMIYAFLEDYTGNRVCSKQLYMTKPLKEELLAWIEKLKQDKQSAPEKYNNCGQLFRLPDGLPIAPELLTKRYRLWRAEHPEFEQIVFHGLRHSSATYQLLQSDGDFKSVQGNTGHATASVLMDTYAHTQDKPRLELTEKIEANFYSQDLTSAASQPRQNEKPAATKISGKEILEAIRLMDADERRELTRALFA